MTLKKFGLDYGKCSLSELQCFMKARSLVVEKRKEACIVALELADTNATFRFEDLPGELRNRVYYELLLLPESEGACRTEYNRMTVTRRVRGCHPRILATSSAIREEASSILYGANDLRIVLQRGVSRHPRTMGWENGHHLIVLRVPMQLKWSRVSFGHLRTPHENWPSCLLKFQNVRIHITTIVVPFKCPKGPYSIDTTHTLYSLISFLQRSTSLKTLSVFGDANESDDVTVSRLSGVLYPLARLFPKLKLEGFANNSSLEQRLRTVAIEHKGFYKKNTLHYAVLVREESKAYQAMTDISSNTTNLRQHIKLRREMFRVFNQPFEQQKDEQELLEWADKMAQFLTKAHEAEVGMALSRAGGFWLAAMKRFDAVHKTRIKHFPEPVDEE